MTYRVVALLVCAFSAHAQAQEDRLRNDWAFLRRYQEENANLAAASDRVVFMGNSITEGWAPLFPTLFPGKQYVGRGIGGQTTPQMLVRFRQDVIALKPRVVVILAGTNDIAGNTGPSTLEMIQDNIASMAELARANGIRVVLSSVLPAYDYPWKPGLQPAQKIMKLNAWIRGYAAGHDAVYVDYHSAMQDERHGLRRELAYDGVHPNEAGYRVMASLVERAIAHAMRPAPLDHNWAVTGGDPGNSRYSALRQINGGSVSQLRVAWTYHTGDLPPNGRGEIQATPIVVDGVLYTTTPALAVIALRADSGTLLWRFDPFASRQRESHVNRGVVYWADGGDRRILFTAGRRLYALDARTGRGIATFGDSGSIDLGAGLSRDVGACTERGECDADIVATSPGVIYRDLLIQGTRVGEGEGSAPGHVRAYDVRTGALRWTFHTIPHPGDVGHDTWPPEAWRTAGGANSWAGMAVDVTRGLVYVPTGSATPDFYGGDRVGANLFANSLLALDAQTGQRLWHFQTVHHDLWDRDLPAAPNLVTVTRGAARVDAVAQITKSGFVFLFDRGSGRPLFDIEERAVPASDLAGEQAWPTQPFPLKPAPFARQTMGENDLTDLTAAAQAAAITRFRSLRHDGLFAPPSRQGTVVLPGFDGGGEWGGAAVDPATAVLYVNASDVPWIAAMRESAKLPLPTDVPRTGPDVYAAACAGCHGDDRRGRERGPSLMQLGARLSTEQVRQVIERGRGFMPSFAGLPETERRALIAYLGYAVPAPALSPRGGRPTARPPRPAKAPYEFVGYERWRDSSGFPAIKPPWGTLSAIDLNTGEYLWRIPLGDHAAVTARGILNTGTEQYGGPIVTAGGLVFIAATQDAKFRAFDAHTGRLLWDTTLPAPGYATPSTYAVRGKQYVVIAAGGGKLGSKSSDAYVAFTLP